MRPYRGNWTPLRSGSTVSIESGCICNEGMRIQLSILVADGEYWVVEDLGRLLTLQPKRGGANVRTIKA